MYRRGDELTVGEHRTVCWITHRSELTQIMHYDAILPGLFIANRDRLKSLMLPNSLAVVNANDVLPTNADGALRLVPNADLYYLTGIGQEESILLLYPDADDEKHRELLFLREAKP